MKRRASEVRKVSTSRQGGASPALLVALLTAAVCGSPVRALADIGPTFVGAKQLNLTAILNSATDQDPTVTTDGAGNWITTYSSSDSLGGSIGTDGDVLFALSTDEGLTWTPSAPLNANAASDSGLDNDEATVVTDGAGTWVAVWESTDSLGGAIGTDFDILVARSTDAGATWSYPTPLNQAVGDVSYDRHPRLATDGLGNWIAVWSGDISDSDIYFARSTDGGLNWTTPATLNNNAATDSGGDGSAQIATDRAGTWIVTWSSSENLDGVLGSDLDILSARSIDAGATWSDPIAVNHNATSDSGADNRVQISTDEAGSWLAIWESNDDTGGEFGSDYDLFFARSDDGGTSWSDARPLNINARTDSIDDNDPQIETDTAGNWVAVWFTSAGTGANDADILYTYSGTAGTHWTWPRKLVSYLEQDTEDDYHPEIATDRAGRWIVVWQRESPNGFEWDIYVASAFLDPDAPLGSEIPTAPRPALWALALLLIALGACLLGRRRLPSA